MDLRPAIRHIVAEGMHPWVYYEVKTDPSLRVVATMPTMTEILEAADRLIDHLKASGYQIIQSE